MEHELEGARKRQEALNNMEKGVRTAIGWRGENHALPKIQIYITEQYYMYNQNHWPKFHKKIQSTICLLSINLLKYKHSRLKF